MRSIMSVVTAPESGWQRHREEILPVVRAGAAMLLVFVLGAICISTAAANPSTTPAEETTTTVARGFIGPYRIGMSITERSDRVIGAHYYYARHPDNIPLTGRVRGEHVILRDTAGRVFRLHFVTNTQTKERPLTFYYSTGLVGTWKDKGKTLPVKIDFDTDYPGTPSFSSWYSTVTDESAGAFERRVQQFLDGIINDDPDEVAATRTWPITAELFGPKKTLIIHDKAELLADWKEIDTAPFIAKAKLAVPHEMFVHDGAAMADEIGYLWFGPERSAEIRVPAK